MGPTLALLILSHLALYTTVTSKKVCGRPLITDGIDDATLKRVYEVGEEVTLTYEQGYLPSTATPRRLTCTATGEWTLSDLSCSQLSCCLSSQRCPPNWREINSRCYFLSTEQKTWEDSRKYCQSKGADLVVINSEEEQRALYRMDRNQYLLFWIGLHDTAGTFKWVDGSALNKTFWQSGQPGDGGPNNKEECVEMYHFNPVLANWNDAPCGQNRHWLCERTPCASP